MWIEAKRRAKGWSRAELARRARCSEALIELLEEQSGAVTHPRIAARIAAALRAAMRDLERIVPEQYRSGARYD